MRIPFFSLGACFAAAGVAAGAAGAHALRGLLDARGLELWATGARYLLAGGLAVALLALGAELRPAGLWAWAAPMLAAGIIVFAGTVLALALGAPRWLGAVTPIGGLLMIAGLLAAALAWARGRPRSG